MTTPSGLTSIPRSAECRARPAERPYDALHLLVQLCVTRCNQVRRDTSGRLRTCRITYRALLRGVPLHPVMSLWKRLGRRRPAFSSAYRKTLGAFFAVLALCYLAVGVIGFVLGRGEASSIAWTILSVGWGGLTACYWFRWPRGRFPPEDVDRGSSL